MGALHEVLTEEQLQEIEGDVLAALRFAKVEDDTPPDMNEIAIAMTGGCIQIAPMRQEGKTETRNRVRRVQLRLDVIDTPRGRQIAGHELGHVYGAKFLKREVSEEWCDAFGAMLSAPRRVTQRAIAHVGHSITQLADLLEIEPAAALLRVGEVTGRPVALERRPRILIARGEPYPWPPIKVALRDRPAGLHPVRAGARWGMMRAA
jgi:hypothetical protein